VRQLQVLSAEGERLFWWIAKRTESPVNFNVAYAMAV